MTVRRRRPPGRPPRPSLQLLRDPKVLAALRRAIDEYTEDAFGCECTDAAVCFEEGHENALSHPQEFYDWILSHTKPPPRDNRGRRGPELSQDRRARWARKTKAHRRAARSERSPSLAEVA